jgi:hypothetical protein
VGIPRFVRLYYAATPVFVVVDALAGAPVRAAAFAGHPGLRAAWYGVCLGCLAVSYLRPAWSAPAALLESSANLLLLALSVFLPYYALLDGVLAGVPAANPFTPSFVVNLLLASGVWIAVFQSTFGPQGTTRRRVSRFRT